MNFDKYIKEVKHLMHVARINYNSISVERFDDMKSLLADKVGFHQFQQAREDSFEKVFGYEMARWGGYIFLIKKTSKQIVYIEVELKNE